MAVVSVPQYGGYDYIFASQVPERFVCNICTKVLREPHLTVCCGQHFCESCLKNWFMKRGKKSCPHCREEKDFTHVPNKERKRDIFELKIYCTHHGEGCQWVGKLGNLQTHLDKVCGCVKVECTNRCHVDGKICTFQRKALQDHLDNECSERWYQCKYCGYENTYRNITGKGYHSTSDSCHYDKCCEYPLDCSNECGAKAIKRKDMSSHRDKCLEELVECPNKCVYRWRKCRKLKRKDLPDHLSNECYRRMYKCEHCGLEDTFVNITGTTDGSYSRMSHYDKCPEVPLNCPNYCGAEPIKRKDMSAHRDKCPRESMECPFEMEGCKTRVIRKDFDNHMATQTQHHLLLLRKECHLLKAESDSLKKAISANMPSLLKTSAVRLKEVGDCLTIQVPNLSRHKTRKLVWRSPPFYIKDGYKMCLALNPNGTGKSEVSLSLVLMKGEFDDLLEWPISCYKKYCYEEIEVEVLSKHPRQENTYGSARFKVTELDRVHGGEVARSTDQVLDYGLRDEREIVQGALAEVRLESVCYYVDDGTCTSGLMSISALFSKR